MGKFDKTVVVKIKKEKYKITCNKMLIAILQVLASRTKIYIILEYITGGELFDKIVSSLGSDFVTLLMALLLMLIW